MPGVRPSLAAAAVAAIAGLVAPASCARVAFVCEDSDECDGGVCEANGRCSFEDDACESGRRYGEYSGDVANECVPVGGEDAGEGTRGSGDDDDDDASGDDDDDDDDDETDAGGLPCEDVWWDPQWAYRVPITVTPTAAGAHQDVPLLLRLDSDRFDPDAANADGSDLRFVDADDTSVLAPELESYDADSEAIFWVRVPELDEDGNTFYAYYGNANAVDGSGVESVWSEEYRVVSHLGVTPGDSTGNVEVLGTGSQLAVGRCGYGQTFPADGTYVSLGTAAAVGDHFWGGGTASAWIFAEGWGGGSRGRIFDKTGDEMDQNLGWYLSVRSSGNRVQFRDRHLTGGEWTSEDGSIGLNHWHWVVVTYDSGVPMAMPSIYIDGVAQDLQVLAPAVGPAAPDVAFPLWIGEESNSSGRRFDGVIDEVRFSQGIRTPAWIALQYLSMTDSLLEFGSIQERPAQCDE